MIQSFSSSLKRLKMTNNWPLEIGHWSLPRRGFTLVELIVVMGLFAFMTALLLQNLFSIYRFREVIRYKKEINLEASLVLNNGIAGMLRSGFGINYDKTQSEVSNYLSDASKPDGLRTAVDQLAIYLDRPGIKNDKGGRRYLLIQRNAYSSSGDNSDTAGLTATYYNGDEQLKTFPLHSSELVVEDFDVMVPKKPVNDAESDLQPYVTLYLRVRHRYPYGDLTRVTDLENYQKVRASYQTTYMIRNTTK